MKLSSPELVLVLLVMLVMLDPSNCCFVSRDVDFEPRLVRLDEVLVKFSETHQTGSEELICQNYMSWLISI